MEGGGVKFQNMREAVLVAMVELKWLPNPAEEYFKKRLEMERRIAEYRAKQETKQ